MQERNRIANRIQKVLEDGNIKLASVATDSLGASGRAMLKAMIEGEEDAGKLAEMSCGLLRNKIPELQRALEGRLTSHHRFLLKESMEHLEFVESKIARLEREIGERLRPFEDKVERLCTIPGVKWVTASGLIAEIGLNMNQFGDAEHLASWAGLCPGNYVSAGKAIVAVAHNLLEIAFYILRDGKCYRESGADYFDRLHPDRVKRRLVKRLERLGFQVTLAPVAQPA